MPFAYSMVASVAPPSPEHDQKHAKLGEPVSLRVKLTSGFVRGDLHLAPVLLKFIVQIERLL